MSAVNHPFPDGEHGLQFGIVENIFLSDDVGGFCEVVKDDRFFLFVSESSGEPVQATPAQLARANKLIDKLLTEQEWDEWQAWKKLTGFYRWTICAMDQSRQAFGP